MTFFAKNGAALTESNNCKCNGMAGFRGTRLLIEGGSGWLLSRSIPLSELLSHVGLFLLTGDFVFVVCGFCVLFCCDASCFCFVFGLFCAIMPWDCLLDYVQVHDRSFLWPSHLDGLACNLPIQFPAMLYLCSISSKMRVWRMYHQAIFFFGRRPLPFGRSHLRLPSGPAGIRTTIGSLSALARPTPYQLSHRVA